MSQLLCNNAFSLMIKSHSMASNHPENKPSTDTQSLIAQAIENDALDKTYIVVPTGKIVRRLKQQIIRDYFAKYQKPVDEINVFTLKDFAEKVFQSSVDNQSPTPNTQSLTPNPQLLTPNSSFLTSKHHLSDAYRMALFEEAVGASELHFYKKRNNTLSYAVLSRLANIIFGLKEDGITPADMFKRLSEYSENPDGLLETGKYGDIAEIYSKYEIIKGDKYIDDVDVLKLINKSVASQKENSPLSKGARGLFDNESMVESHQSTIDIQHSTFNIQHSNSQLLTPNSSFLTPNPQPLIPNPFSRLFPSDSVIHFEGFTEFKMPEIEFLGNFNNVDFPVSIRIDYLLDEENKLANGPLFGNIESTIINLSDRGFLLYPLEVFTAKQQHFDEDVPLSAFLRRWLFNTERKIDSKKFSDIVKIIAAENRLDEVKTIAKLVKWLLIEKNISLYDICIVLRRPEIYSQLFREIFREYKIPVNITDRYNLSSSTIVMAIFAVLDLVINGYKRDDINKILNTRFLTLKNEQTGEPISPTLLFNTAMVLRISGGNKYGGRKIWEWRIGRRLEALKKQVETLETETFDQFEKSMLENEIRQLSRVYDDFKALCNLIQFTDKYIKPQEFKNLIKHDIIEKFDIAGNIYEVFKSQEEELKQKSFNEKVIYLESIEKDTAALNEFLNILNEFTVIQEDRHKGETFLLSDLTDRLKTAIQAGKFQIREKQNFGVTVTSIEQTREMPFKVGILCGALDGEFPMAYRPESFLGDDIPSAEETHISSERMQFYQFLTNSSELLDSGQKEIFITYPKYKETEELVRSPFVDALLRISNLVEDNKIYDLTSLRKSGEMPPEKRDTSFQMQIEEIPFIFSIASENEKNSFFAELFLWGEDSEDTFKKENFDVILSEAKSRNEVETGKAYPENLQSLMNTGFFTSLRYVRNDKLAFSKNFNELYKSFKKLNNNNEINLDWDVVRQNLDAAYEELKSKAFSVSELETYIKCPYQYFLRYMLRLPQIQEYEAGLSPLESGNLYHIILFRFYNKLRLAFIQKNIDEIISPNNKILPEITPVEIPESGFSEYLEVLREIAYEEIEKIRFPHPYFDYQAGEILGTKNKMGLVEKWLRSEFERRKTDEFFRKHIPILFELGFGLGFSKRHPQTLPPIEIDENFSLTGKIDRLEWNREENTFIVADYKSSDSGLPSDNVLSSGKAFQIPLYLLAAQKIIRQNYDLDLTPAGGVYYILKPKFDKEKARFSSFEKRPKTNKHTIENQIEVALKAAKEIKRKMLDGYFPVKPENGNTCNYCTFANICRISE